MLRLQHHGGCAACSRPYKHVLPIRCLAKQQLHKRMQSDAASGAVELITAGAKLGAASLTAALLSFGLWTQAARAEEPLPSVTAVEGYLAAQGTFFEPMRYVGRWYEVASLKQGFAGEGQQDCHCTQGVYLPKQVDEQKIELEVNTFCWHGSPEGRLSGIQGRVTCAQPELLALLPEFETELEMQEEIKEKCVLRFPSLPFVPPEPYDVIRTDYTSYALVQGAVDRSFVQIYSRTPNPGPEFIQKQREVLASLGYDTNLIADTPQDCPEMPVDTLMGMMSSGKMDFMTNTVDSPAAAAPTAAAAAPAAGSPLKSGIQFSSPVPRNPVEAAGDVLNLLKGLVQTQ